MMTLWRWEGRGKREGGREGRRERGKREGGREGKRERGKREGGREGEGREEGLLNAQTPDKYQHVAKDL